MVKAALFDVDGTFTETDKLTSYPVELPGLIKLVRNQGTAFVLSSGRDRYAQGELWLSLVGNDLKPNEGILSEYVFTQVFDHERERPSLEELGINLDDLNNRLNQAEDVLNEKTYFKIFGNEESQVGGLLNKQRETLKHYILEKDGWTKGMVFPYLKRARSLLGMVTEGFVDGSGTNEDLLAEKFSEIKPKVNNDFPYVQVTRSKDAIDFMGKDVSKARTVLSYSQITGISLSEIVYFGDSSGDMPAIELVLDSGGTGVYVGKNNGHITKVNGYANGIVTKQKGPRGTLEAIKQIFGGN